MTAAGSTDRSVRGATEWSPIFTAMRAVQTKLGRKAAAQLALITKSDMRTAQRFLSEDRVPNGTAVYLMVRDPVVGIAFIQEATRNLPPAEHRQYWSRMAVAVGDALRERDG